MIHPVDFKCPWCRTDLTAAGSDGSDDPPNSGVVLICAECSRWMEFVVTLKKITRPEAVKEVGEDIVSQYEQVIKDTKE